MQIFRVTLRDGARKFHTRLEATDATVARNEDRPFLRYVEVADIVHHAGRRRRCLESAGHVSHVKKRKPRLGRTGLSFGSGDGNRGAS